MATNTDIKPAKTEGSADSAAKVGDGGKIKGPSRFKINLPRVSWKKVVGVLIVVALIMGVAVKEFHIGQKVYAQAAGHKIYKKDIDALRGNNKKTSDHDIATVLANKYLTEAMAKQHGITVTDKDILAQYGQPINYVKTHDRYSYQLQVNTLYFNKLQAYNQGIYKGNLLVANFSRFVPYQSPLLAQEEEEDPQLGNAKAIAQDKQYALKLLASLSSQIQGGKITWAQAGQIERSDPIVGTHNYPSMPHSGPFDTTQLQNALFTPPSVQKELRSLKVGQTSKPFAVSVVNSTDGNSTAETYALVIHLDSKKGGTSSQLTFAQELAQAKKSLKYKVYV